MIGTVMTDVSMSPVVRGDVETSAGGGGAASGPVNWLGLAAAPTFAIMALWTGLFSGQPDMLCMAIQGSSPMSGMTLMYLLMSAFNAAPWLGLISRRQSGVHQAPAESTRRVVFEQVVRSDGVIE
jgi:hypothetical protein